MDLTVREMQAFASGAARRDLRAWRVALFTAWQTASLSRARRLPNLKRLMDRIGRRVEAKSTGQLLAKVEQLNAVFGGRDERNKRGDG